MGFLLLKSLQDVRKGSEADLVEHPGDAADDCDSVVEEESEAQRPRFGHAPEKRNVCWEISRSVIDEREAIALGADQSEDGLVGDGPEKGIGELEEEAGHEMEVAFGVLEPEPESHYLSRLTRVAVEIEDEAGEEAAVDGVEHVELFLSHRDGVRGSGEERRRRRRHWKCDGGGGKEGGEGFVGVSWDAIRDVWRRRA